MYKIQKNRMFKDFLNFNKKNDKPAKCSISICINKLFWKQFFMPFSPHLAFTVSYYIVQHTYKKLH